MLPSSQFFGTTSIYPSQTTEVATHCPSTQSFASHAARNPLQPVIPPNQRQPKPVDKVSRHAAQLIRQDQQAEYAQDLEEFQADISSKIMNFATKYHRKPRYMRKVLIGETHYKKKRAANIYNAKVAYKRRELQQAGKTSLKLHELQEAVQADASLQELSLERKDELLKLLEAEKKVKKTGARINNRAAAHDYRATVGRIGEEIASLECRTGVTAFAFFSRSHVNDNMQPEWVSTSDALRFLPESMQTSAGDMGRKLELWACSKDNRKTKGELQRLQSECSETISQKLKEVLNSRDAKMSYQYYDSDIRSRYKVQLRGWPGGVRFMAPGKITTLFEVRTLHEALHSGSCFWATMSSQESADLAKQLEKEPMIKKRRPRKSRDENREAGPSQTKRRKAVRSAPVESDRGAGR